MLKSKINLFILLIAATSLLFTGCSISGRDFSFDIGNDNKTSTYDEIVLDNVTAVSTDIRTNVGSVTIDYNDTNSVEMDIKYTASGNDEDKVNDILEVAEVKAEVEDNELKVTVVNKNTDENIWKWIDSEYHKFSNKPNFDVDLDIKLPVSIQEYNINCNVGDIDLNSLTGKFDIVSNVGSINLSDIVFIGDSELRTDVGDITCSFNKEMKDASDISIISNIGNIRLDTKDLDYTTEDRDEDNKDFLGSRKDINIKDLCSISTEVSLGNVDIE